MTWTSTEMESMKCGIPPDFKIHILSSHWTKLLYYWFVQYNNTYAHSFAHLWLSFSHPQYLLSTFCKLSARGSMYSSVPPAIHPFSHPYTLHTDCQLIQVFMYTKYVSTPLSQMETLEKINYSTFVEYILYVNTRRRK